MTTETVIERPSETNPVTQERVDLALEAAWELESISLAIIDMSQTFDAGDLSIRGMAIRVRTLASVVMSALGDEGEASASIRSELTGKPADATEASHV